MELFSAHTSLSLHQWSPQSPQTWSLRKEPRSSRLTCHIHDNKLIKKPNKILVWSLSLKAYDWSLFTLHMPSPPERSRTLLPQLSGRKAASHLWQAAGRQSPHPPSPQTAKTRKRNRKHVLLGLVLDLHHVTIIVIKRMTKAKRNQRFYSEALTFSYSRFVSVEKFTMPKCIHVWHWWQLVIFKLFNL